MRHLIITFALVFIASCDGSSSPDDLQQPSLPLDAIAASEAEVTSRVYFDLAVDGEAIGRLVIGLFGNDVPLTSENFRALSTGEKGLGLDGQPLHFEGSVFHRIIPGFVAQGGDITRGDGRGGESIYGRTFADESFRILHSEPGLVSMANAGRNTNSSQFFITFAETPWLNGLHVVFGRVVEGMELLSALEAVGTEGGTPSKSVTVLSSGEL